MSKIIACSTRETNSSNYWIENQSFSNQEKYYFENSKEAEEVTEIRFFNCNMASIPKIINWNNFANLEFVDLSYSNLLAINKADLIGLEKVQKLHFDGNKLEYLPGDLLEDMEGLKELSFYDNRIKYIDKELIQSLKKLEYLDFRGNANISRYYEKDYIGSCSLELIEKDILENCKVPDDFDLNSKQVDIKKCKLSDFENLLKKDVAKDFTITIQDRKFKVHKFLLMARSPMLFEKIEKNPRAVQLQLEDIAVGIFEIILKFMYDDVFPPDDANFKDIFIAAGRLKIDVLKNYAAEKMIEQVDGESAFEYSILANEYEHEGLRMKAFSQIKEMFPDKELSETFAEDPEKLQKLRKMKRSFDEAFGELQK